MNENDIWNGYRLGESKEKTNDVYYMIAMQERNEESSVPAILKIGFYIVVMIAVFAISMYGPSMWHNTLVVCNGNSCTTYTEWKVIGENRYTGVLEVWAGGRLQRLSNGTWHYE